MATYGDIADVQAYCRHMTFGADNNPATGDVTDWLNARAAQLTAWLAGAGYTVPVTAAAYPEAHAILSRYANLGAAGDAELAQRTGGYSGQAGEDRREEYFFAEFAKAEARINGGVLAALGVERADPARPSSAFSVLLSRQ